MGKIIAYHATSAKNVRNIKKKGLLSQWEGVYLTDSEESAARWIGFRLRAMGEKKMAVIKVEVDEEKCEPGTDHSPIMEKLFGVGTSILHQETIPASQILDIILYQLNPDKA